MRSATIATPVELSGRGLFSGAPMRAWLRPAPRCSGLTAVAQGRRIPIAPDCLIEQPSCTVVGRDGARVQMVEHLLAALWASGIDTVELEVDGDEVPNVDGSALPVHEALREAGRIEFSERPVLSLREPLRLELDGASLALEPADTLSMDYRFAHPELGVQRFTARLDRGAAAAEILPARSFITTREADAARAAGLLRNENPDDALVLRPLADGGVEPSSPLRFPDEFARHKVLDFLGDLYILPFEWTAAVTAERSGHRLNRMLARRLWELYKEQVGGSGVCSDMGLKQG